jgi:thiamine biosynthesis lipoprotein ApbE
LRLIEESQTLYKETGGLFDIAIYPVMKLWGFPTQEYRVPAAEEIKTALKTADAAKIAIGGPAVAPQTAAAAQNTVAATAQDAAEGSAAGGQTAAQAAQVPAEASAAAAEASEGTTAAAQAAEETPKTQVTFGLQGMEIDLGGIAKGFTSSRVMEVFKEHGVEHGLVSLGGNVQALGAKENGKAWRVAIQNPESELDYLGVLDIEDKCVITSGGYERFFEKDGVRYHHIIDPRTGYPADSGIISATIISKDGTLADGLSTSLFIMGKDEAEKYWRSNADRFDYILEDKEGKLYVTEGAADLLTTEAETEVVKK